MFVHTNKHYLDQTLNHIPHFFMSRHLRSYESYICIFLTTFFISSCTTRIGNGPYDSLDKDIEHNWPLTEKSQGGSQCRYPTELGIRALRDAKYGPASKSFNSAIRIAPQNSYLHYLNGLTYHMWALKEDPSQLPNAAVGYQTALKFDPGNTLAAYSLGQIHMETREFSKAQNQFANGLLSSPFNPKFLLGLACASYMNQDVPTALQAIQVLETLHDESPGMFRAAAFIYAAANEPVIAQNYLDKYIKTYNGPDAKAYIKTLQDRLQSWKDFYLSFETDLDNLGLDAGGTAEHISPPLITEKKLPPPKILVPPTPTEDTSMHTGETSTPKDSNSNKGSKKASKSLVPQHLNDSSAMGDVISDQQFDPESSGFLTKQEDTDKKMKSIHLIHQKK